MALRYLLAQTFSSSLPDVVMGALFGVFAQTLSSLLDVAMDVLLEAFDATQHGVGANTFFGHGAVGDGNIHFVWGDRHGVQGRLDCGNHDSDKFVDNAMKIARPDADIVALEDFTLCPSHLIRISGISVPYFHTQCSYYQDEVR